MRKISKIEPKSQPVIRRKRVAAYARVSVETDRLIHSLSAQVSYYSKRIQSNPAWEYAGVYADRGISGTGIAERSEFQRLLADCESGKIDIILTKSISRFARNTVDLLETVRHLKEIGVEIRFEKENISSFSGDGELMLTILASFAQEESRSISENIKWAKRKGYEKGKPGGGFTVFGYRWDGEKFVVEPEEAKIVKLIFENYLHGIYAAETAKQLNAMGIKTCRGNSSIHPATIQQMLQNEKYTGCMVLQKEFTDNVISKKRVPNTGQLPKVYVENSHEAIISVEDFLKVQEIMKERRELGAIAYDGIPTGCFSRCIHCGCCGKNYQRSTQKSTGGKHIRVWQCGLKKKKGRVACDNVDLPEEQLKAVSAELLGLDTFDEDTFAEQIASITVMNGMILHFQFFNGKTAKCQWIPIPKQSRSERMKGNTYGKYAKWSNERRKAQSERMKKRMQEYWAKKKEEQHE